jgi:gamma-glutamyltranspeptidase / glutathione hydrolase
VNRNVEQWQVSKRAVASEAGVVAAQHWQAAQAGAGLLAKGGNAVDAAVAAAFALAAVEPWMCGLGGSGYMVVWRAGEKRARVLDFQGMLPAAIDPADYPLDPAVPESIMGFPGVAGNRNVEGYGSILVPGAVAGLAFGLERFGTVGLDTALGPAIALAERGLAVDWFTTLMVALAMPLLARDAGARAAFLPDGAPPAPERRLALGALPATLRTLAHEGPDAFYRGRLARLMAADLAAGGSRITADDFAAYEVLEPEALCGSHRGAEVHTAGRTSGGLRLLDALAHIARHLEPARGVGAHTFAVYAEALNVAWRAHKRRIGRDLLPGGTSHLSAVDGEGNMVALTYTLLNRFGSGVVLPQTGILMNNAVSYFDPRAGFPTTMAPHKRINASNMCPIVVTRDGHARFALGASGANHIMPAVTQIAALMLDYDLSLEAAFHIPRIDASDRGSIRVDPRAGEAVLGELARHFELEVAQQLVFPKLYACPSGVARDPATGLCSGISDPLHPIAGAAAAAPFVIEAEPVSPPPARA